MSSNAIKYCHTSNNITYPSTTSRAWPRSQASHRHHLIRRSTEPRGPRHRRCGARSAQSRARLVSGCFTGDLVAEPKKPEPPKPSRLTFAFMVEDPDDSE